MRAKELTYSLQTDDSIFVRFSNLGNEFVLSSRHRKCRPVEPFTFPFRSKASDDDHSVRRSGEFDGILNSFIGVDFLATTKSLGKDIKSDFVLFSEGVKMTHHTSH